MKDLNNDQRTNDLIIKNMFKKKCLCNDCKINKAKHKPIKKNKKSKFKNSK